MTAGADSIDGVGLAAARRDRRTVLRRAQQARRWASTCALFPGERFGQGVAPSHDLLALHHAGGLVGALAGSLAAGGALAGSFVFDVDDGEPRELDDGVVGREVAAGLGGLAALVVQGFDAYLELWRQPGLRRPVVDSVADGTLAA
jgi:hypothetical protein